MKIKILALIAIFLLTTNCGKTHLVRDLPAQNTDGTINVVIEIPAGTTAKWEVNKTTGKLEWEIQNGKPRIVDYLAYPGNYGFIPQTVLPKKQGGDGDPLDVLVLAPACERGEIVAVQLIGVLKLLDRGEQDNKLIAAPIDSKFAQFRDFNELGNAYPGLLPIIETWFANYKGVGKMEALGFRGAEEAKEILEIAKRSYEESKAQH